MGTMASLRNDPMAFLRAVLRANALFSSLSGAVMILGGAALGAWLGRSGSVAPDGVVLVAFAAALVWLTRRETVNLKAAGVVVALDGLWVLDTTRQVLGGQLSSAGNWFYGVAALIVLDLAVLQAVGVYRAASQRARVAPAAPGTARAS